MQQRQFMPNIRTDDHDVVCGFKVCNRHTERFCLRTVSEILGHGSVQVTGDIYGHVSSEGARAAVDRLAVLLGW